MSTKYVMEYIIFSYGRCGTTLLADLIGAHLFNKEFPGEMQKFKDMRKNVLAREEPRYRAGPSTRKSMPLPKSKPKKKPLPKTLPKSKPKKKNGVTFDTTGTLPGKTIRKNK